MARLSIVRIRAMETHEAPTVSALYAAMADELATECETCDRLTDASRQQIEDNLRRTPDHPEALCLVVDNEGEIVGFATASLLHHPVIPGIAGELEEIYVQPRSDRTQLQQGLAERALQWLSDRDASVIWSRVARDDPNSGDSIAFWADLGFEHDHALLTRYR